MHGKVLLLSGASRGVGECVARLAVERGAAGLALVGRDTKLPDYLVLLSTLGGFALFGINGFVIGPLIAALFIAFWQIFAEEFNPTPQPVDAQTPAEQGE